MSNRFDPGESGTDLGSSGADGRRCVVIDRGEQLRQGRLGAFPRAQNRLGHGGTNQLRLTELVFGSFEVVECPTDEAVLSRIDQRRQLDCPEEQLIDESLLCSHDIRQAACAGLSHELVEVLHAHPVGSRRGDLSDGR